MLDSLSALHGMVIYQILGLFYNPNRTDRIKLDGDPGTNHAELHQPFLLKMSRRLCRKYAGILRSDPRGVGISYQDWVLAETLRRTLFLVSLVNDVACRTRALNPIYYEALEPDLILDLPLPCPDEIWTACTQQEWRAALAANPLQRGRPVTMKDMLAQYKGAEDMNMNDSALSFLTRLLISGAMLRNEAE